MNPSRLVAQGERMRAWLAVAGSHLRLPWLTANLKVVLLARLTMSAARALSAVVVGLYLATQGFSAIRIGAVFTVVSLAVAAMSAGVGVLADRIGRKPFLVALPLVTSASAAAFTVIHSPSLLILFAALGSLGRGTGTGGDAAGPYKPAESALIADSTAPQSRTQAFALLTFTSTLGAFFGALLSNLVHADHITGASATAAYRPAFLAVAALAGMAGIAAIRIRESSTWSRQPGSPVFPMHSWPALWRLWLTNAANGIGVGMAGPFMSYWLYRRFEVGAGTIGLLFAAANLASLAAVLFAPKIGRVGTIRAIAGLRLAEATLTLTLAFAPTFGLAAGLYLARSFVSRIGLPLRQSYVQGVAPPNERARMTAFSRLPAQGTQAGGQLLAGYLIQNLSLAAPFAVAGLAQLLNGALYAGLLARIRPDWEEQ